MTQDLGAMKQRFMQMTVIGTMITLVAVAFAVAHFIYGVGWALWAFVGLLGLGFAVQLWFVRGIARMSRGK